MMRFHVVLCEVMLIFSYHVLYTNEYWLLISDTIADSFSIHTTTPLSPPPIDIPARIQVVHVLCTERPRKQHHHFFIPFVLSFNLIRFLVYPQSGAGGYTITILPTAYPFSLLFCCLHPRLNPKTRVCLRVGVFLLIPFVIHFHTLCISEQ